MHANAHNSVSNLLIYHLLNLHVKFIIRLLIFHFSLVQFSLLIYNLDLTNLEQFRYILTYLGQQNE